ncbi:hypothetical protein Tco_0897945 [Tanacetum coccineum]
MRITPWKVQEQTKEDRKAQLVVDFDTFRQNQRETIPTICRIAKLINTCETSRGHVQNAVNTKYWTQKIVREQCTVAGYGELRIELGIANPVQARQIKCYNCNADDCDAFDSDVDAAPTS